LYNKVEIGTSGDNFGSSSPNTGKANDQYGQLGIMFLIPSENRYAQGEYRAKVLYV
jgi:hypothetical protein